MADPLENDKLCRNCGAIDIRRIIEDIRTYCKPSKLVRPLGIDFPPELSHSSCPLCTIIIWMLQVIPADLPRDELVLAAACWSDSTFYTRFQCWAECSQIFTLTTKLGIADIHRDDLPLHRYAAVLQGSGDPDAWGSITSTYLRPCPINNHHIDYGRIQRWLSCCNDRHGRLCQPALRSFKPDKVIDCVSRSLVTAPQGCEYIALSYVWGRPQGVSQEPMISDFQRLPATIQDAIVVVLALGYRYLWIDRYCIEQADGPARHLQIQQMGDIYNSASVTIIAAAGSSPYHGLPGVSQTPRIAQPRETILGSTVIGFPDQPSKLVRNSIWNTRA
jgi:hypothetical protein